MSISINQLLLVVYLAPFLLLWGIIYRRRKNKEKYSLSIIEKNQQAGLAEPNSLHPSIDKSVCIGCAACVDACPEGDILGIIRNKAELINPAKCIGHGACKAACPVDAISLVFGTSSRGVDIPFVDEHFETNVSGIFIAGELGGMGLIRNAVEQGKQSIDYITKRIKQRNSPGFDVVIIGAGPAGIAATLNAMKHKLRHVTLEQETLGGTVSHYPRGKIVMTAPVDMPLVGKINIGQATKEKLLDLWIQISHRTQLKVNYQERMETIVANGPGFIVTTNKASYPTRFVLLCIGRRGTPRKLGVPGEESNKVVYRLVDPEQYRNQHVLVVGGGNSAVEAAMSIAAEVGTTVTLSYRSNAFSRVAEENREKLQHFQSQGKLKVIFNSEVKMINPTSVALDKSGQLMEIPNDAVIVSAGGVLPTPFLVKLGISVETKHGTA